jgi:hypothetical protein
LAEVSHPPAAYERSDVSLGFVGVLAGGFAGTVALVIVMLLLLFPSAHADRRAPQPPVIPAPRLQPDPSADLAAYRARTAARRDSFGWLDRAAGRVHLPVGEAMREQVRRGWSEPPE